MRSLALFAITLSIASAAPMLRLSSTVVGPVSIAAGAAGPVQEVEAFNTGDGALHLTFTSTALWLTATAGQSRRCSGREGDCIPIRIAFPAQSLATGLHSATLTVSSAGALDAPQNILVTVQIGGGVPARLEFFVPPNGAADEIIFHTNSQLQAEVTTQSGGSWLSVALDGLGSFRFVLPYKVTARHVPGMTEGTYNGAIVTKDSRFAADNRNVPVSLRVTSQPIAAPVQTSLRFRIAQNTGVHVQALAFSNRGLGTLNLTGASSAASSGGAWLSAETVSGAVTVRADSASLAPGIYKGEVNVTSNGANSPLRIPVECEVIPQSAPSISYQGVVNNADFDPDDPVAQGGIAAVFGEQLAFGPLRQASSLPLPTELGGVRVFVNDRPAPIFFTSYNQINFQIPYDAQPSLTAQVRVEREGQRGNTVTKWLVPSAPRILPLTGLYGVVVNSDGTFPVPRSLGIPNSRPARAGDALTFYALGLGQTSPPIADGAAAPSQEPLARVPSPFAKVLFGALALPTGVPADVLYVGLTPGFAGLYQFHVVVPEGVTPGDVPVRLQLETVASNYVLVTIE